MYSERIKKLRETLELSVAKLSAKIDIPQRTITSYERNERMPSLEFVAQLCKVFNMDANWFITGEGEIFKSNALTFEQVKPELALEVRKILKEEGLIK